jgi:putative phosphoribosyl transferase
MIHAEFRSPHHSQVLIPVGSRRLRGDMDVPSAATGMVLFAHGSGSSRHSPRNRFVAAELQRAGLGTLLMDLLEEDEAQRRDRVFDIELLTARLLEAARWLETDPWGRGLRIGYFGASTGAAAALVAAAQAPVLVSAVVSRGGRPDLAESSLPLVRAPTLLIVGGEDVPVLDWNRDAYLRLKAEKELVIVPGATHLFEELGALEAVARHASRWFVRHLSAAVSPSGAVAGHGP